MKSIHHRRLLVEVASSVISWAENRNRVSSLLKQFFFDEDKAAHAFWNIDANDFDPFRDLASVFLKSPSFSQNSHSLFKLLQETSSDVLELVIHCVERMLRDYIDKREHPGSILIDFHDLQDLFI